MEKEKIKEKKIDILALWRSFITPAVEEASTEEVILNDSKLSETKKKELLKYFGSVKKIQEATIEELMQVKGINEKIAKELKEQLNS